MRNLLCVLWIVGTATGLAAATPSPAAETIAPTVLRADPDRLCEASGIASPSRGSVVVVDNEIDDLAFGFAAENGTLRAASAANVGLTAIAQDERPHDVEAVARVVQYLVLVGSHSRNEDCEIRPNRERMLVARLDEAGTSARTEFALDDAAVMQKVRSGDETTCLQELFTQTARPYPATRAFCRALVDAERAASKAGCATFAIEGAATLFEEGRDRLWLGLRAPLVDGKAVLVRLARIDELRFDVLALVDLEGRGIRELASRNRALLAIAGPPVDAPTPFALWKLTPSFDPADYFAPALVRKDLPTSSEGLLPTDDGLVVVVDGAAGTDGGPCKEPARQYQLPLD